MITPGNWCTPGNPGEPGYVAGLNRVNLKSPLGQGPASRLIPGPTSNLCALGWRPILITGLLKDLLARHFAEELQIEEPDLRHLIWQEGPQTGILIESIDRWRGDLAEKRPAIVLKRNAYQNLQFGVGDSLGGNEQGQRQFCTGWIGSHTLFCIHGSGSATEILATEVQRELTQFAHVIIAHLGLLKWVVTEVGAISELEESRETFVAPITVGWAYQEVWSLNLESLKLREISFSMLCDC